MADLTYTADLNDKISAKLKNIENNTQRLASKMEGLGQVIAGLAVGAAITRAIQYADAIQDISNATGIAVEGVLGFSRAVELNGGSAESAQQAIVKLVGSINEAAEGSKNAQIAFSEVGVSLQDLQTLSEQEILSKTIAGLGQISDQSKRAGVAAQLLGKSFRTADIAGVAGSLDKATQASIEYAKSITKASELQGKLDIAVQKFTLSVLKAIEPLVDFFNKMDDDKIEKLIGSFTELAAQIGALAVALFALEKAAKVAIFLFGSIAALTSGVGLLVGTLKSFRIMKAGFIKDLANGKSAMDALKTTTTVFATKRLPHIISGFASLAKGALALTGVLYVADTAMKALFDKSLSDILTFNVRLDESNAKVTRFLRNLEKAGLVKITPIPDVSGGDGSYDRKEMANYKSRTEEIKKQGDAVREVSSYLESQLKTAQEISKEFAKQNQNIIQSINLEAQLVGKTDDEVELRRALSDLQQRSKEEIDRITQSKAALAGKELELAKVYDQQIAKIKEQTAIDTVRLTNAITNLQTVRILEQARLQDIENTNKALEDQIQRQNQLGDALQKINDQRVDLEFERAQQGRTPLEQQIEQIKENARKAALEAGRAFAQAFDNEDGLSPAKAKELADGLDMIAKRYEDIANIQIQNLEASMTWEAGWKDAFDKYIDNATNAANRARDVFSAVTSGMERLISDFVDTGKFKFKDFARSVIAEILKIEMKAAAANLWKIISGSMGGGKGGLLGGAIIPGFLAEGGNAQANKPYIVGERGPELFVPKGTGTVVPNNQLGASQPVTNNYVYNISAVDAQSVARLFANNRQALLGSVEQAKKELPTRRGMR